MSAGRMTALTLFAICSILPASSTRAQEADVAGLVHPEVAERLSLDDTQRAKIQQLLLDRAQGLAAIQADTPTGKEEQAALQEKFQQDILAVLTPEQKAQWSAPQPTQKLMFQFRDMKWEDVLGWFSSQQDLTLVMDRTPGGTFTYSDTRSYSPSEGIDLLNSVLMTRGFTLVRREKMLVVMELNANIPLELLPRAPLEQLDERGRFEIVSVLFPLAGRPIDAVLAEVKPYLSSYGRAIPLARGGQLLVVETAGKMSTINELIASVPVPKENPKPDKPAPPPQPVFAAYALGELDSNAALETVRKLIPSEQITVDGRTGVLSAFVIPAQQTAIKSAIDQMQASHSALPKAETVAYRFSGMKPEELQRQIAALAPRAILTVTSDSALVTADAADQQIIHDALKALDIQPVTVDRTLQVLEVSKSSAEQVATALRTFLPNSYVVGSSATGNVLVRGSQQDLQLAHDVVEMWRESQGSSATELKIYPLTENQRARPITLDTLPSGLSDIKMVSGQDGHELLVWAAPEQHVAFAELLTHLDQPLTKKKITVVPKSYGLNVQSTATVTTLLAAEFPSAQLTVNTSGDELTVLASPDQHERIAQRVAEFNTELPSKPEMLVESYSVDGMTAAALQQALLPLLTTAHTTLDSQGERLLIRADSETHAELHELAAALGAKPAEGRQKVVLAYQFRGITPAELQLQIVALAPRAIVTVTSDRALVTADAADQQIIRVALKALDIQPLDAERRELKIYPLTENQRTRQITLDTLPSGLSDIKMVSGQDGHELLVWAAPEQHVAFADLLTQLDQPLTKYETTIVPKSYRLEVQNTATVTTLLAAEFPTVQLTVNTAGDELTVLASPEQHERIALRVAEFNAELPSKPEMLVESYSVDGMTAVALQQALLPLLATAQTTLDSQSERLLIRAAAETHSELHELTAALGAKPAVGRQKVVLAYPLTHAMATNVKLLLDQIVRDATVLADDKLRQVVVTGSLETQSQVKAAIDQIDRTGSTQQAAEIRSYDAGQLTASALLTTLQAMWPSMQLTVDGATNQVVASGTPEEHQQLEAAFEQLTSASGGDPQLAKTYAVPFGEMSTLPSVLKQLAPRALISSDPISRTVTVWAAPPQQKLVEQALEALGQTARDAQQPATYVVKPTQLLAIQTSLRTLFPTAVSSSDPTTGQLVVVASQEVQQRIASVIEMLSNGPNADETTTKVFTFDPKQVELSNIMVALKSTIPAQVRLESNLSNHTLLAIGSTEDLERVSQQVQQLLEQLPAPDVMSSVVYPLRHANPQAAVTVLARLIPSSTLAPDVASKTISATAKAEDHKTISEFLSGFDQPAVNDKQTHIYRLKRGNGRGMSYVLTNLMPDATFYGSPDSGDMVATALPEQHERIAAIVKEFDNDREDTETRVFATGKGNATSLRAAIKDFSVGAAVTADQASNSLIVTATAGELDKIGEIINQVEKGGSEPRTTRFYPVLGSEPVALSRALEGSFTKATFSADSSGGGLFATASEEEHAELAKVIEELNAQPTRLPTLKTFTLKHAKPEVVAGALEDAFGRRSSAGVSFSRETRSVFVVGSRDDLQVAQSLVEQIDVPGSTEGSRTLRVFPLEGADGRSITNAIENLFPESSVPVEVRYDSLNEQLFVVGEPEQLTLVEEMLGQLPAPDAMSSVVYPLRHANPLAAVTVLTRLLPQSTLAPDVASKTISATAKTKDHETIAEFLSGFDQPAVNDKQTHVYRLKRGNGRGLSYVLTSLMPEATFYGSPESGGLVATALPEQHERIAAIIKEFDNDRENTQTRVFATGKGNATSLQEAIKAFSAEAAVTADRASNSLIVTATAEELDKIGEIVDQVERGGSEPRTTRFYPVLGSEPVALSRALEGSFSKATFSADSSGGGLFASANEEEHAELAKVIEELNSQPTRLPTLKSFVLKHASPEVVAGALDDAFGRRSLAGVSFNRETRSVFVVGSRDDLQVAQTLVDQIDVPGSTLESRKLRVFSLKGADGRSITDTIENLFPESSAPVEVRYDLLNEQLFVVGEPEQLKLVEEMLEQLTPPERQLEIVQLDATDPYTFKLTADALFEDEPVNSAPSITVDSDQQRVIIRATETQLVALRKLLQQMGETPSDSRIGSPDRLRFIPVHRNSEKLLEEIRRLWPSAGGNTLQIIRPAGRSGDTKNDSGNAPRSEQPDSQEKVEEELPAAKLTSAPQTSPIDSNTQDEETANAAKPPAIVVVVGDEQWTVASADTQALDQFQRLLDTLLTPRIQPYSSTGNYSVYLLRHAGADQVQELLDDLFRPERGNRSERGRSSPFSDLMQRVKIVADSRINALIVSGNRQDRRTVEDLLGVLDSEDLLDSLQQISPTTLALESASANNVESILRDVYRSQLSSGAGRRPVPIPEGVSSDVASLLQQLNAQSSGPLLTLAVDETSNSIVFRAPIELTSEIRSFVESLDRKSQQTPSKRVDLIRLQSTNTKSLQQALKILLAK